MKLESYLHQRIIDKSLRLYKSNFYREAAATAMTEVEIALKEKTGEKKLFGRWLIQEYFTNGQKIHLVTPLSKIKQETLRNYFDASFEYYRNYCAHNGSEINNIICVRILIIASELLELIDASVLSITDIGGVDSLIKNKFFDSKKQIADLLDCLTSQTIIDDTFDGMFEEIFHKFTEKQYNLMFELGLVNYCVENSAIDDNESIEKLDYGYFQLTDLGLRFRNMLANE